VPSQAQLIRESWAVAEPAADRIAQYFYAALFHANPSLRDMFPATMTVQRIRLLRALTTIIQVIDQPDRFSVLLAELGRDHRKFEVTPEHYDQVGDALFYALKLHMRDHWTPEVQHAWEDAYAVISREMRRAADEAAAYGPPYYRGTVVDIARPGHDIAIIKVKPEPDLVYRPGQYVSVETPRRPRMWRPMSMANAPSAGGELEFHVKTVPGGWVSGSMVTETQPGDVWKIGPPLGLLGLVTHGERDLLLVTGGTGIGPVMSMLPDLEHRSPSTRLHLFHGVRYSRELYLNGVLDDLVMRDPMLDVVKVVSREPKYTGVRGSLPDVVAQHADWSNHDVVVSGSPSLIQATVRTLSSRGVPLSRIYYDTFTID
jgi:NAD(P)H-flavin reductase/hemoglobin-like flavoprotein